MITYTGEEVNLLSDILSKSAEGYRGTVFHIIQELRRGFRYGHNPPYIVCDHQGESDGAFFIQQVPFEDLPKYVNDKKMKILLEWRLRIGK